MRKICDTLNVDRNKFSRRPFIVNALARQEGKKRTPAKGVKEFKQNAKGKAEVTIDGEYQDDVEAIDFALDFDKLKEKAEQQLGYTLDED